jgi:ADP-heptose:LPS heptosyltransferase
MFSRIRKIYPGADIYLLQFTKNKEMTLLADLVAEDHVVAVDDGSLLRFVLDSIKAIMRLRSIGIDTVLDCELFSRISSIYSLLTGAGIRVGFHPHTQEGLYRGGYINRPVLYNPYRHISRQFLSLVDAIQSTAIPPAKGRSDEEALRVRPAGVTAAELSQMAQRLEDRRGWRRGMAPDILIYPGGGILPIRAWPAGHFQALCRRLVDNGYSVGIIGPSDDRCLAGRILHGLADGRYLDLTGFTANLRELIVLFHLARLLIANDGGPGQFAALTPISTMIFFGPETPTLYGPIGEKTTVLYAHAACSPCLTAYNHRKSPCDGDNQCLRSIDVARVHHTALDLLARPQAAVRKKQGPRPVFGQEVK